MDKKKALKLRQGANQLVHIGLLGCIASIWVTKWSLAWKILITSLIITAMGYILDWAIKDMTRLQHGRPK